MSQEWISPVRSALFYQRQENARITALVEMLERSAPATIGRTVEMAESWAMNHKPAPEPPISKTSVVSGVDVVGITPLTSQSVRK